MQTLQQSHITQGEEITVGLFFTIMKLDCLPIGQFQENTYLIHDNNNVLIIDPGASAKDIFKHINDDENVVAIVLTHGHVDHTIATDDLCDRYDCEVYIDANDYFLVNPKESYKASYCYPIYHDIKHYDKVDEIKEFPLEIYNTPGHTSGSVCIKCKNNLFTGDTLFSSSIGRTDLYSGNEEEMIESLRFLKQLPKDLKVYPGHGPSTSIGDELLKNPYLVMV